MRFTAPTSMPRRSSVLSVCSMSSKFDSGPSSRLTPVVSRKLSKEREHPDLERRLKLLVPEKLAHLLLDQRHDETLAVVLHTMGLVVGVDAAAPPLPTVEVLRVLLAV